MTPGDQEILIDSGSVRVPPHLSSPTPTRTIMSEQHQAHTPLKSWYALGAVAGLVILLLAMQGSFADKVKPGTTLYAENPLASSQVTAVARLVENATLLTWPATVTARTETHLAARLTGRIMEITVRAGDPVRRGQVLVRLDPEELKARVAEARAGLASAEAQSVRAHADDQRIRHLYAGEAATRQELDASTATTASASARVTEAREAVHAIESLLADAVITAPYDGRVIRREQEPGDMALPGRSILSLQQAGELEIEATIPVGCAGLLHLNSAVTIKLAHDAAKVTAHISEIQPAADPVTHTVLVKARLPETAETKNLKAGSSASLQQPCGQEAHLTIPETAITRSGQLESVQWVGSDGIGRLRHVRTGKRHDGEVEILSGLEPGDRVLLKKGVQP